MLILSITAMSMPHPMPIINALMITPVHSRKVVEDWLPSHPELEVIDWPTNGCDTNTENLWVVL